MRETLRIASLTSPFAPRSVAVPGASGDPSRIGGRPVAYLPGQGFAGCILTVNPRRAEVPDVAAAAMLAIAGPRKDA
jgi:acyl-CoA synthetase (NDP forming)